MSDKEDSLFKLIQSLSPSEKRHFTIYAARHTIGKQNNSVRMFKKLEGLKTYDEEKFLLKNKQEAFANNYGYNKHFLYKLVLQSLHSFHAGKTIEAELLEQLHCIDILSEKGLFNQARALIKSCYIKAKKYQFYGLTLEFLGREMSLNRDQAFAGKTTEDIKRYTKEFEQQITNISTAAKMETFTARVAMQINKSGLVRNKEGFEDLQKLQQDKNLKNLPPQFHAAWHFYTARVGLHFLSNNYIKAYEDNEALIKVIEENSHLIPENPKFYLLTLNNQMVLLSNFRRYDEMLTIAKKIEEVPVRTQLLRNRKFNTCYGLIVQMYAKTGEFEKGIELLKTTNKKLENNEVQFLNLQLEISHYLASANMHFGLDDFSLANKFLGQIIDRSDLILRSDILCFSLIMRIITQFEMQKQDLLEYTVRSAYRFLYKRNRLYKFEDVILRFIKKKAPNIDSQTKLVKAFKELYEELIPLTKDPAEKNAFAYFDIISWLESKIQNKPFNEVVKLNYKSGKL